MKNPDAPKRPDAPETRRGEGETSRGEGGTCHGEVETVRDALGKCLVSQEMTHAFEETPLYGKETPLFGEETRLFGEETRPVVRETRPVGMANCRVGFGKIRGARGKHLGCRRKAVFSETGTRRKGGEAETGSAVARRPVQDRADIELRISRAASETSHIGAKETAAVSCLAAETRSG